MIKHIIFILFIELSLGNTNSDNFLNNKFSHKQQLSMGIHHLQGIPISSYFYSNKFKYTFHESIITDLNIHGRYIINPYSNKWNLEIL